MTVFVYNTPQVASPVNDRRAGTIRVGSDSPDPIQVLKGWDTFLYFAFRDINQKAFLLQGRTVTARLYNQENVELWNGNLTANPTVNGAATLKLLTSATASLEAGLYNLIIEYEDDFGNVQAAMTMRSRPRFVIDLVDYTTVDLNI